MTTKTSDPPHRWSRTDLFGRLLTYLQSRLSMPARYALAVGAALAAFGLRWLIFDSGEPRFPILLGYPAVVLCAALLGAGPAILAAGTTAALPAWFLLSPLGSIEVHDPIERSGLLVFLLVSILIAYTVQALTDARVSAERARSVSEEARRISEEARAAAIAHAAERNRLLAELNHRVQNANMAVLSIADLQARSTPHVEVRTALLGFRARIRAIGLVHDLLSREKHPEEPVNSAGFIGGLVGKLQNAGGGERLTWHVDAEPHPIRRAFMAPLGFIINELVVNALKHAFPDDRKGYIAVRFRREGDEYVLQVEDNGVGMDQGDPPDDPLRAYIAGSSPTDSEVPPLGFGKRFVTAYARNLGGRFESCQGQTGGGTVCTVRFPVAGPGQ